MKNFIKTTTCVIAVFCCLLSSAFADVYTSGHGDIAVAYENGQLELHWHISPDGVVDGAPVGNSPDGREFAPGDLMAFVSDPAFARPDGDIWNPIGTGAGEDVWFLPQSGSVANTQGKPFLGLNEELDDADWSNLQWSITSLVGPGEFSLWQDGFSPSFKVSSVDGLPDPFVSGHDHFNWGFTAPGLYEVGFTYSGDHVTDGFQSDSETFRFLVAVPEPGSLAALGIGALGFLTRRRRRV